MYRQDLAQLSLFQGFDPGQLEQLIPMLKYQHFQPGETIFEQGKAAQHLYILLNGEVVVRYKPYDGPPLTVARIRSGGVFGWSAAMMRDSYSSGAQAAADSEVLQIAGFQLRKLCEKNPDTGSLLLNRLAGVIAERLQHTHTQIVNILTEGLDLDNNCDNRIGDQ